MKLRIALVIVLLVATSGVGAGSDAIAQDATPVPEMPTAEPLLEVQIDGLPSEPGFVGIARLLFPPGTGIAGGSRVGPRFFLVERGEVIARIDAESEVHRAHGGVKRVLPGEIVRLQAGDRLIGFTLAPFTVENHGDRPAIVLDLVVWEDLEEQIRVFTTEGGVVFEPLTFGHGVDFPEGPAKVVLDRIALERRAAMPISTTDGPHLLHIETGNLGLAANRGTIEYASAASNNPGSVQGRLRRLEIGTETMLTAGGIVVLQRDCRAMLRNLGRGSVELLVLRVVEDSEAVAGT
jgi:hypothetical protein